MEIESNRTRWRALTVLAAPVAALTAWAVVRAVGVDLVTDGGRTVGAGSVFVVAALAALAGWGVVAVLERHTRRPELWWGILASGTLSLSTLGPDHTASGATLAALLVLHFAVGLVVMGGLGATLGRSWRARTC